MKKIAIVIAELGMPGGAEKVAADLAVEFHRRGHTVSIVKFERPYPGEQLHTVPCRIIDVDVPERAGGLLCQLWILWQRTWRFRQVFRQEQFDHIFAFMEAANLPTVLASAKSVLSIHKGPEAVTSKEWLAMRWFYRRARRVVTVSQQMQTVLADQAGLNNCCCIYNPVDQQLIREKAAVPIQYDGPFILAVGRLEAVKRFDLLLESFARSKASQQCRLLIIGAGACEQALKNQIMELGLESRVQLLGFDDNPYRYMARAGFQVMSSDSEGYPLVLIEALALGCPVIATDCPTGPREIIQHGMNGLLVEQGDAGALAAAMDQLFFNRELHDTLSQQAPTSVQQNDIAVVADQWLAA